MRTDTFLKIAEHQHTGSADGAQLSTGSIAANAITGAKIRLANNEYLRSRNAAGSDDINALKINASDKIELGAEIGVAPSLINNIALQHRNAADSAYIATLKINAADKIELGANILSASVETLATSLIDTLDTAVVLADNQTAVTAGVISLGTDESCTIKYRLVRNGVTQSGTLEFTDVETIPQETYVGTDVGVTFTVNAGDLEYATTSTGNTTSMTYVVIKE